MQLTFEGRDYELRPGESVLDAMARHGVGLPSACRVGSCQACMIRSVSGDPGPDARRGLKATWLAAGYFLACLARPSSDLTVAEPGDDAHTPARLISARPIGPGVLRVLVRPDHRLDYQPGQHVTLSRAGGITRIYSIVSLPAESARTGIELHVRVYPAGAMSGWLARARPATPLILGSPAGECFYVPGNSAGPLLLAGTGTGIAPLLAVARAALAHHHRGPVVLIHGAARPDGLYLGRQCPPALTAEAGLSWRTCLLSDGEDIAAAVTAQLAALTCPPGSVRAYLCGGARSVRRMRRALFMAGMSLADIYADQFVPAGS
ncbi:MAG TPA: 2Fe-2S iron-sulfur cluster binding domain-containing protein [Streptosporangiaceae bacterium]|nr:2Fe-2S iron-sulfur cluster binding domain-containing protein [Streptosporangiaceae bacterium]